jgi:hypothetical protein
MPATTIVPAGEYKLLFQPDFAAAFTLAAIGDDVLLSGIDAAGNLGGYREDADFSAADRSAAFSFGRHIKSTGGSDFVRMSPTPGAANTYPDVGPVVITELMYHPDLGGDEFIEIRNVTRQTIDLSNWKFTSGVNFTFPAGTSLAPGAHALVVAIAPATFRSKYSIPASVTILGPYTGSLDNAGEKVVISKPTGAPADPYIEIDRITYNNKAPWPLPPAGAGPSLARMFASRYPNDVANWRAETGPAGTPGVANTGAPYVFFAPAFTYSGGKKLVAQFSENVSASANDLTLHNLTTGTPVTSGITFSYDPATFTATWTLPAGLPDANYRATLLAAGLTDGSNTQLDGDYNGTAGPNLVHNFFHLTGDVNQDRKVDNADFMALYTHFGQTGAGWPGGDLNHDGVTNFADFQILERAFGKTLPVPSAPLEATAPAPAPVPVKPTGAPAPKAPRPKPATTAPAAPAETPERAASVAPATRFATQRIKPPARRTNDVLA